MYIFIVNPTAGNGRARKMYNKLINSDTYQTINSEVYFTEYKGHAEEIVSGIVQERSDIKAIIVIGGDGTVHEVANGLGEVNIPISPFPAGSGNDFSRGCLIKGKPEQLLQRVVAHSGEMDYWFGHYEMEGIQRRFANNIGFGFDAEVAKKANESRHKKVLSKIGLGIVSYLIALVQVLFTFKPKDITFLYNGEKRQIKNCWLITIGNHPYYGGGMKLIPTAKIEPKKIPVLIVHSISKIKVLTMFLTVLTGYHLRFKEVELIETEGIEIYSKDKIYFHADGETNDCTEAIIKKESKSITVLGSLNKK